MFAFVILHYLSEEMTKECVECLEKHFDMNECRIIIVDNASPNGSGVRLKEVYKDKIYCDVILHNKNDGFARGNNVGYKFAKEKYNPEYMIIMNNDVLINDSQFLEKIKKIYSETNFHILGPDIISKRSGMHQNPHRRNNITARDVQKEVASFEKKLKRPLMYFSIYKIKSKARIKTRIKKLLNKNLDEKIYSDRLYDSVLHGACLIFSKNYIRNEGEAFDPRTYMYGEEYLLNLKCCMNNYLMIYDGSISVLHLDGFSTNQNSSTRSEYQKYLFFLNNALQSRYIFLDIESKVEVK